MIPTITVYIFIFFSSMDYAQDRPNYLSIIDANSTSRVEPLLTIIAKILNVIVEDNYVLKLAFIQLCFFALLLRTLYKYFVPKELVSLNKCFLALLLILLVASNYFGVQLRLGYASIIFLYLIVSIKKLNIISCILLCLPVLMHYGTILSVLLYIYFNFFKIDSRYKFIKHSLILFIPITVTFLNIDQLFQLLGVANYYYIYLNEELSFGRLIPYTALFYILNASYLIVFHKRMEKNLYYWFSLSGLWLIYIGFFLNFYLAFKMLTPIIMVSIMYTTKNLSSSSRNNVVYLLIVHMIAPITFYYFIITTDLKLF